MNCPTCRRHLWYEGGLSNLNKGKDFRKVYACASCGILYVMVDFPTKIMGRGVGLVWIRRAKVSPFLKPEVSPHRLRGGVLRD